MNSSAASSAASPSTSCTKLPPAWCSSASVASDRSTRRTSVDWRTTGWSNWSPRSIPVSCWIRRAIYGADLYADLAEALAVVGPVDVVVIAAPIGAHFRLAEIALAHGADVLLEKPPVASLADFHRLLDTEQRTGRVVQVGFQSLGSAGLELFESDAVDIGRVLRVGAVGAWSRTVGYWTRSPWAGRRSLGGQAVVDGVVTNPLAHAVATALAVDGCRRLDDVASVETDLYRANAIDADDTSVVRITTADGRVVTCALSLCAPDQREPLVHVVRHSWARHLRLQGGPDRGRPPAGVPTPRRPPAPICWRTCWPTAETGPHCSCRWPAPERSCACSTPWPHADEPVRIDPRAIRWARRRPGPTPGGRRRRALAGAGRVDRAHLRRARSALGPPRARPACSSGSTSTVSRSRSTVTAAGPYRPPVRARTCIPYAPGPGWSSRRTIPPTTTGTSVSAWRFPDVNGTSFWGGGTYVHGQGYVLLDNHGLVVGDPPELEGDSFTQRLRWIGRDGSVVLAEQRSGRLDRHRSDDRGG